MTPDNLAKVCRCGHARRFHQQGTIWQGYETTCLMTHHNGPEAHPDYRGGGCSYFEARDDWQDAFAEALRSEGYIVQRPVRNPVGRFAPRPQA